MSAVYTVKPLDDLTIFADTRRKHSQFKASWSTTVSQLATELRRIGGKDAVLEIAVSPRDVRIDGQMRAYARPSHPGVRLSFHTREHGELSYTAGGYWHWQDNVRAIVLTLEALRAVDRYGATKGEQYAGFKALPSGSRATPLGGMTKDQALAKVAHLSADLPGHYVHDQDMRRYAEYPEEIKKDWKHARARCHPDRHDGDRTLWDQVEQAGKVLGLL